MNLQARNLTALRADWARRWPVVRGELMGHLFSGPGLPDWPEIGVGSTAVFLQPLTGFWSVGQTVLSLFVLEGSGNTSPVRRYGSHNAPVLFSSAHASATLCAAAGRYYSHKS